VIAEQCKARAGEHHGRDRHERRDPELSNVQSGDAQENREAANMLRNLGAEVIDDELRSRDLNLVLERLKELSIQSVLVEGGRSIAAAFLEAGLVDKVSFFIAPMIIGGQDAPSAVGGLGAGKLIEAVRLKRVTTQRLGSDIEITGYPEGL